MKTLTRLCYAAPLGLLLLVLGCDSKTQPQPHIVGGNTNWLQECGNDDSCDDGSSCICGICTAPCDVTADCQREGAVASECRDPALGQTASTCASELGHARVCLPACETDDCRLPADAGSPPVDAGSPPVDAGSPPVDAGSPPVDAGSPLVDAGSPLWPPLLPAEGTCDCGDGDVCGAEGCQPACDAQDRCALWPTGGQATWIGRTADTVLWITGPERDPAGNPLSGQILWMGRPQDVAPTRLWEDFEGNVLIVDDQLVFAVEGGFRTLAPQAGAEPSALRPVDIADARSPGAGAAGMLYGFIGDGATTGVWQAPLDGSAPATTLVALEDDGYRGMGIVDGGYLVLPTEQLDRNPFVDPVAASPTLGSAESWDGNVVDGVLFPTPDTQFRDGCTGVTAASCRTFFTSPSTGAVAHHGAVWRNQLYYVAGAAETYESPEALERVGVYAYSEPEVLVPSSAFSRASAASTRFAINDAGAFWVDFSQPGYVLHTPLEAPACDGNAICGPDSHCGDDGRCAF